MCILRSNFVNSWMRLLSLTEVSQPQVNLRIMYVSSDELRIETSITCRRGFLSQTAQIFYDFKLLFCRRQRRNVNTLKTQVLHIRSFFATSSLPPLSWSLSCNTQRSDPVIFLPLLFLIVVSAPCCKSVTAITLCPLTKKKWCS